MTGLVALVAFDRLLRQKTTVSLVRAILPGAAALVIVTVPGLLLAALADGPAATLVLGIGVAAAQLLVMERLYRRSVARDLTLIARRCAMTARIALSTRR